MTKKSLTESAARLKDVGLSENACEKSGQELISFS